MKLHHQSQSSSLVAIVFRIIAVPPRPPKESPQRTQALKSTQYHVIVGGTEKRERKIKIKFQIKHKPNDDTQYLSVWSRSWNYAFIFSVTKCDGEENSRARMREWLQTYALIGSRLGPLFSSHVKNRSTNDLIQTKNSNAIQSVIIYVRVE